ncbi:hypothetical protein T265_06720 [Opisthorchis viverrini]|uniref:Uncharacterized protein n=1 Tax=Opisthorchis viverrini TaxID=6198 RepID=A0A075AD88_OPIVI|nr:hypothetical protein T265_06720 [Opisthorchis viverrini]KER25914.1 hypothetical protein T265_06720 [Opisthorchis viverrini]
MYLSNLTGHSKSWRLCPIERWPTTQQKPAYGSHQEGVVTYLLDVPRNQNHLADWLSRPEAEDEAPRIRFAVNSLVVELDRCVQQFGTKACNSLGDCIEADPGVDLWINEVKTQLPRSSVTLLGHKMGHGLFSQLPEKLAKIEDCAVANSKRTLRQFFWTSSILQQITEISERGLSPSDSQIGLINNTAVKANTTFNDATNLEYLATLEAAMKYIQHLRETVVPAVTRNTAFIAVSNEEKEAMNKLKIEETSPFCRLTRNA